MAALTSRYKLALLCGLAVCLLGCQEEPQIRRYQVPVEEAQKEAATVSHVRLLAAIFPQRENTWFFKLVGPATQIDEQAAEFEGFVRSVRFPREAKEPVIWQVPAGWRAQGGRGLGRYATFRIGPKEQALELRVNRFGPEAGNVLDNVNRWRDQDVGLPKITEAELGQVTRQVDVDDVAVTLVDMIGPGSRKAGMGR